jgi:hypothetical protein
MSSKLSGWLEIEVSVALAIAAQPIDETGHAIAARMVTGVWPQIGFWAVRPTVPFPLTGDILAAWSAGDVAVTIWWGLMPFIASREPDREWVLIGPTFSVGLALINWLATAVLSPFGYCQLGASDAAKFIEVSGLAPATVATTVTGIIALIVIAIAKIFPLNTQASPVV